MSRSWNRDGSLFVVVATGMPEQAVEVGIGNTPQEAAANLEPTAIQSVGRDSGRRSALNWARNAGWILDGADRDRVVVETMPDCWRESHRAAGNWGTYPANGAERTVVGRTEAEQIVAEDEDGYARIVRDADALDLLDAADEDECEAALSESAEEEEGAVS